ncbi:SusC/RagA family TonB-linked outer membrane protein [Pedobacter sp. Leaf176]|uniref:SusC/RagA family TonB-linked outer membrane protein n=1 Tax=Pedobacter sp. Leaf176 TaxID=1736286 RepID=UPI0006FABDBD|nr:SusC/RagA family TonB-linked outer membrane protein [Pedobacter sp. Leaf176]KQR72458.1 SusC/RagA family TonB-linked outer membrane protein [Pedobacter sp. Leaf176]
MKVFYLLKQGLLVLLVFSALIVKAQTGSISGKVLDETGQPLPGASIYVKGTTRSTSTDADGNFKLSGLTNGSLTLSASFIGYQTLDKTVNVTANANQNFQLVPDAQKLNEVVVIGYGTAEKKNLTGSITTVSSKDFQKGTITTPEQLIQGKVAGVNIISSGGAPGSGSVIRVRGGASLNASSDPLIVVDGVPFSGNSIGNAPSPLSLINPNDIETFTVLKDANATAIYGSRASNGVILITTKKGASGLPVINFNTNNSIGTVAKKVDVLSADEVRAYVNANGSAAQKALLGTASTDWQDVIYRTAFTTDNNLSIAGSFKGVPYRVSAGYLDQQGVVIRSDLKRATGGFTLSPKLFTDHLKIDLSLKGTLTESQFPNDAAIGNAIQFDPTKPVYAANQFGGYYEWINGTVPNPNAPRNPLALIEQQDNHGNAARSFGNARFDYSFHFLPELHANLNLGYDVSKGYGYTRVPIIAAQSASTSGSYLNRKNTEHNKFSEFYLNYAKNVESINSRFDVTAGYGYYDNSATNFNYTSYKGTGEALVTPVFPFSVERQKLLSYYGRFVYTLADKYILSGTMRADASSRFSEENRWGYFPSAGFTWRIVGEDFLKDSKVVSDLKLRLSYGETGQKDGETIGNYSYLSRYYANTNTGQYQVGNTFYNYYSPAGYDPDMKWETTTTYNAGLDYGFLKGRLYGSVDAYYKKTKDLLSTINIPVGTNFTNLLTTNVGNMEVKGIEASLNFVAIQKENVTWDVGFNMAYNKRKITNLTLNPDPGSKVSAGDITGGTGVTLKYNAVNQVPSAFFVYKQVYNANGVPLEGVYADLNSDGVINTSDQYFYKSPDPNFTFGFNTSFTYKKWTINTVLRANIGNYIYDNVSSNFGIRNNVLSTQGILNNSGRDIYNTNFQTSQYLSDYYIKNASFLKMDNVGLVYNLGKLSANGNTTMRISANCQNVFVVSEYKGIDPESVTGIDYNFYPRPRTFTLGLNVGF